jgi:hypothetical protein
MRCADVTHWFDANRLFSEQLEQVADRLLTLAQTESRIGCEVATSAMLLAVLVQGGQRPPTPDDKDRCHFVAGLSQQEDGAETLARTSGEAEVTLAIRAVKTSNAEFGPMHEAEGGARSIGIHLSLNKNGSDRG